MEYKKNDMLTVTIEDIGNDGEGIGKVDGYTLFVKDAVMGDTVSCKIMKAKKNYAYARLEKILEPSDLRCAVFTDSAAAVRFRRWIIRCSLLLNRRRCVIISFGSVVSMRS